MTRHAYTISYLDSTRKRCEFCTYANDSFEARLIAMETIQYVHEHPNSINYILRAH